MDLFTSKMCNLVDEENVTVAANHCIDCKKSFSSRSNLTIHRRAVHEGVRFQCKSCEKSFATKVKLQDHETYTHKAVQLPILW